MHKLLIIILLVIVRLSVAQELTREILHDKILGSLVGSAIGDAMGAPTEMWHKSEISKKFGFINNLDSLHRPMHPEGPWLANLPAGGTTDDTRWKHLIVNYFESIKNKKRINSYSLAKFIDNRFKFYGIGNEVDSIKIMHQDWLREWQKVAQPYIKKDWKTYQNQLSTFYGGEMVCGGLLYAPVYGLVYYNKPEYAYNQAFDACIWDIGYARDLSAITAFQTAQAIQQVSIDSTFLWIINGYDPYKFEESRLVGRRATQILALANEIVKTAQMQEPTVVAQRQIAYDLLEKHNQDYPFHAGEIMLQVYTAMIFENYDFEKTISFLVNNGRDNDTNAAVAGAILGAFYGFKKLPKGWKNKVLVVNKELLGHDIKAMANALTDIAVQALH